ncbi:type III-B CRISPR module RAMP protein Cmr6 [Roseibacillus ishigakijimensis]|uniref:Type III-B CRISPR module RAMP protein Cmr6 n=1 Tax=Roseibacillus ishigakijimensis TaxID=454146 RepID=A0A934RPJ9_9BACT|nr:type III-B CRISPR module RAMP protein Cmr6 [Roseibacillus ishigakijimensis]MBK1832764.1 type III-B CRISPR module RAMP protein Cmr6 [Roseibacillus ishigakijimensis]
MIPLAKDTRESIGAFADRVENRSLLFEKMVLAKTWGHEARFEDAQRFNVLRASFDGHKVLGQEREAASRKAQRGGKNADKEAYKAKVAGALAGIRLENTNLAESRIRSTLRLQADLARTYGGRCVTFPAQLGGRLLINMAGGVMENSGLSLDRITGLPIIPGSAIKGITRHEALWEIRNSQDEPAKQTLLLRQALAIFGFSPNDTARNGDFLWAVHGKQALLEEAHRGFPSDTFKGLCSFLPAQPSSTKRLAIVAEVLTPHFNNNLRPIFFPAVEAGSEFAFAIIANRSPAGKGLQDLTRSTLLEMAKKWLQSALANNGIGAKTGAGYGWFKLDPQAEARQAEALAAEQARIAAEQAAAEARAREEAEAQAAAKAEEERLANLPARDRFRENISALNDQDFASLANSLSESERDEQLAFFDVLLSKAKKERRKQWSKKKAQLWENLRDLAQSHNIELS